MSLVTGEENVYRVREVAEMFRVSAMTIHRLIQDGELRAIRVGSSYRIPRSELERFTAAQTTVGVAS